MHHRRTFLCIAAEINGETRAVLPIHYGEVMFTVPVVRVSECDKLARLEHSAQQVDDISLNLTGCRELRKIAGSVQAQKCSGF